MSRTTRDPARSGRALIAPCLWLGILAPPVALAADPAGFEYAFTVGENSGSFDTDSDTYIGGTLSLPVFAADPLFGQILLGEIFVGYSQNRDTGTFNAPLVTGLGLPAEATPSTEFELTTTTVGLGVKYKLNFLPTVGFIQIQPYAAVGAGLNIFLSRTNGGADGQGDRAGGIAPISPELEARGVPAGQGDTLIGMQYGGGVDFVMFKNLLIGVDARRHEVSDEGADYTTVLAKVGFRF